MDNQEDIVPLSEHLIQGTRYEHLWVAEALDRRLIPAKPEVPVPWDYLVTRLDNLNTLKIQVKGTKTAFPMDGGGTRFQITAKTGSKKLNSVDARIIDILACYVEPYKVWYNFPTSALSGKSVWLYPHNNKSNGQYEIWRHDWTAYAA